MAFGQTKICDRCGDAIALGHFHMCPIGPTRKEIAFDRIPETPPFVYLIGSMRNPQVPIIANAIRAAGFECFDDWYAPGPEADERWREYEIQRGRTYAEALNGAHARNVFDFDLKHLQQADMVVLALPAGKSGHLELGWMLGQGKPGFILLEENMARFDVMHAFATAVFANVGELITGLEAERDRPKTRHAAW